MEQNAQVTGLRGAAAKRVRISIVLGVWGLFYCCYRAYYALGGTFGMFGTPVSHEQWLMVNAFGAGILLVAAVLPVATLPLWRRSHGRRVLQALCWAVTVGCVMHALINGIQRVLSLAGVMHLDLPFWTTIDHRTADLQDLLFNEPWFLVEGLLWAWLAMASLSAGRARRRWLISAGVAIAVLTAVGMLSATGVIGTFIVG
ncbi:DUF3995 domain-containing protein [Nonomuraea sp. NPDC048916]|uniref:DUF3995 domain-containing protein n=1 Tax=Nonomuraea sp. NPDC048916 TaxID=3154232 RepID=UPI0033F33BB5